MTGPRANWPAAFLLALAAHVGLLAVAGQWLRSGGPVWRIALQEGETALDVSVIPAPATPRAPDPIPPEPEPDPAPLPLEPETEPEPVPVLTEPDPEPVAAVPEPEPIPPEPEPEPVPEAPPPAPEPDTPLAPVEPSDRAPAPAVEPAPDTGRDPDGMPGPDLQTAPSGAEGPLPLSSIRPRYPMGARIRGEEGLVTVVARVDARGAPHDVEVAVSSGYYALDAAAVKAVQGARFVSAAPGVERTSTEARVQIRFQLRDP